VENKLLSEGFNEFLLQGSLGTKSPGIFYSVDFKTENSVFVGISENRSDVITASVFVNIIGFSHQSLEVN